GTGRTVLNNKGLAVKKYEPYFSTTSDYETEAALVKQGVTPVLHYDPLGRLIRTDLPDQTFVEVRFDAWSTETWDECDTLSATSPWYRARATGSLGPAEQHAATQSLAHANTPKVEHLDPLGRTIVTVIDDGTTTQATQLDL